MSELIFRHHVQALHDVLPGEYLCHAEDGSTRLVKINTIVILDPGQTIHDVMSSVMGKKVVAVTST